MTRALTLLGVAVLSSACSRHAGSAGAASADAGFATPASQVSVPISYRLQSDIPECLTMRGKQVTSSVNLVFADIEFETTRNLAACICPSKWLLWRSVTSNDGIETEWASGNLLAPEPGAASIERRVVLLADREHRTAKPVMVHVGCAPAP